MPLTYWGEGQEHVWEPERNGVTIFFARYYDGFAGFTNNKPALIILNCF